MIFKLNTVDFWAFFISTLSLPGQSLDPQKVIFDTKVLFSTSSGLRTVELIIFPQIFPD